MLNKFLTVFFPIFFLIASNLELYAQKDKVRYINDMYDYVKEKIQNNEYDFLSNPIENKLSLPHLSNLKGKELYYYSFLDLEEPVLRMVVIQGENEKQKFYAEYLFDNEKNLIFHFEENKQEKATAFTKMKAYFEKEGKLIELWQDEEVYNSIMIEDSKRIKSVLQDSKTYLQIFDGFFEKDPD